MKNDKKNNKKMLDDCYKEITQKWNDYPKTQVCYVDIKYAFIQE